MRLIDISHFWKQVNILITISSAWWTSVLKFKLLNLCFGPKCHIRGLMDSNYNNGEQFIFIIKV